MPSLAEFDAVVEVGGDGGASSSVGVPEYTRVHHAMRSPFGREVERTNGVDG